MIPKQILDVREEDFQRLIDNGVSEGKTIDYKQQIALNSYQEKKDFLYNVSSFANASGGNLIFGITEDRSSGLPAQVEGIDIEAV